MISLSSCSGCFGVPGNKLIPLECEFRVGVYVQIDLWYISRNPALAPITPVNRIIGANPPLPTNDGCNFSINSIAAGPAAAAAPPTA